jgi:hypothetical protein
MVKRNKFLSAEEYLSLFKNAYLNSMPLIPKKHANRIGSYPFICGDSFRSICDHIYDETDTTFSAEEVKEGDAVFVNTTFLNLFLEYEFHKINNKFILVTHNSEISCPYKYLDLLADEKIIAWFGCNPNYNHHKFIPLPLGLANRHWPHGNIYDVGSILKDITGFEKKYLLLGNFSIGTNVIERQAAYDAFCNTDYFHYFSPNKSYISYLKDLSSSVFCLNPFGSGFDCHRMWEALLMGCYVITKNSFLNKLYENLPVIIIDNWNEINKNYLEQKQIDFNSRKFSQEKMYFDYWKNLILLQKHLHLANISSIRT